MGTIEETFLTDIKFDSDFVRSEGEGDLDTISGLENVRQALLRRLITTPGAIPHRPDYGVGVKLYQNSPLTLAAQRQLAQEIRDNFIQDERVEDVTAVSISADDLEPDKTVIAVRIKLVGYGETDMAYQPFGSEA